MTESETTARPHVLVIDDEPNIRDLVQAALRFHGFEVSTAGSGEEGLALARSERPDLILLDVLLPDISGFDVCRRLRDEDDDVPVIYLTARDTPSDTVTGLSLGGDDYVTKPFSLEALIARVRALLRRVKRDQLRAVVRRRPAGRRLELTRRRGRCAGAGCRRPVAHRVPAAGLHDAQRRTGADPGPAAGKRVGMGLAGQSQIVETYVSYLQRKLDPFGPNLSTPSAVWATRPR